MRWLGYLEGIGMERYGIPWLEEPRRNQMVQDKCSMISSDIFNCIIYMIEVKPETVIH